MSRVYPNGEMICSVCKKAFLISDPRIDEHPEHGNSLCKDCFNFFVSLWPEVKRETRIVFEYKKVTITHALRWEIFERDNFTCKECGKRNNLTIDHIKPESIGGSLNKENLQTLCRSCNSRKSNKYDC